MAIFIPEACADLMRWENIGRMWEASSVIVPLNRPPV